MKDIVNQARDFAAAAHGDQKYGNRSYTYHLNKVVNVCNRFGGSGELQAACFLHDTLEDTKVSESELIKEFGPKIAAIVLGVTNLPSKEATLNRTRLSKSAVFVKLCDRIANCEEGGKLPKYQKEMPLFYKILYRAGEYDSMWNHLKKLLSFDDNR